MKVSVKHCRGCDQTKPTTDFTRNASVIDGFYSLCRSCKSQRAKRYYKVNAASVLARVSAYCKTPAGKASIKRRTKKYSAMNPLKRAAHEIVAKAKKVGIIVSHPCEVCGKRAEAHHDDYMRPLDVRWLCRKHHGEWHREKAA